MDIALVVMAAGMGSRYGGIKQMDDVGFAGETLLDYGVYDALREGYKKVIFVIRKDIEKDFRERVFDKIERRCSATYVFQEKESFLTEEQIRLASGREKPWGTIQALLAAEKEIKTPFTVINADDFYGRNAYRIMASYLSTLKNDDKTHAMVSFRLENTMSPSGSVTRAICVIEDEKLVSMEENPKIERAIDGRILSHMPPKDTYLTGKESVSMNFFGFTPAVFESFKPYWASFISKNAQDKKAECLLPTGVSHMVERKEGEVRVFTSPDRWFGMTYPEDRAKVVNEIRNMTFEGLYPEELWS